MTTRTSCDIAQQHGLICWNITKRMNGGFLDTLTVHGHMHQDPIFGAPWHEGDKGRDIISDDPFTIISCTRG